MSSNNETNPDDNRPSSDGDSSQPTEIVIATITVTKIPEGRRAHYEAQPNFADPQVQAAYFGSALFGTPSSIAGSSGTAAADNSNDETKGSSEELKIAVAGEKGDYEVKIAVAGEESENASSEEVKTEGKNDGAGA